MHFVSQDEDLILVRNRKEIFSQATGERTGALPTVWLHTKRGSAPEWAVAQAVERITFDKRPKPGAMGGEDIPIEKWVVYVDTVQWAETYGHPDEVRELAESKLRETPGFVEVFPPVLTPPWPKYDALTIQGSRTAAKVAEKNLETAEEIGVSVEDLIAYEAAKQGRIEVLAAYEAVLAARAPEPETPAFAVEA